MKSPFFSVVIATYNRADMLKDTAASIQAQTFSDFELIIVDDGSKDNTKQLVQDLASSDQRISYLYQDNAERGVARNNGYQHAKGQYVMFFDSDDFMPKDNLENMHALIQNQPGFNFYASKFLFQENGKTSTAPVSSYRSKEYGLEFVLPGNPIGTLFTVRKGYTGFRLFPEDRTLSTMEDWMCLVKNLVDQQLYLGDFVGCWINNHDARSMSQNQAVIQKRLKATKVLNGELILTPSQKKELWAYTYYFCGIHAYLDFNRGQAISYIGKSIAMKGLRKDFVVGLTKALIGKKIINKIK